MTFHYSEPFEKLIETATGPTQVIATARVVIVGSGYGGSVAAYRLSERTAADTAQQVGKYDVLVLERGKEYALGEFPNTLADLPGHMQFIRDGEPSAGGNEAALFNIHTGKGVDVLVGSGLGGTSLINANVAIQPEMGLFTKAPWPKIFQKKYAQQQLLDAYAQVSDWLGIANTDADKSTLRKLKKYQAFKRYADALGYKDADAAPITVTLATKKNKADIVQSQCSLCGNCITGCNVGSKNTLAMNFIPAAQAQGARFFTGASVLSVEPISPTGSNPYRWRVRVLPTSYLSQAKTTGPYFIESESVILAAGTLGSTEILQRSEHAAFIQCSTRLGKGFSTNGDGIAMSFAEKDPVNAVGSSNFANPPADIRPGPTISALAHGYIGSSIDGNRKPFLLEDAAIPAPLVEIIGEVATTAAQFGRLGFNRLPAWFREQDRYRTYDPLAVHQQALQHSQIFLMMCDDSNERHTQGELIFDTTKGESKVVVGHARPVWHSGTHSPNPALDAIDQQLSRHDRNAGLNAGQYVHNPLWKLLPDTAANVMNGKIPGGRLLTVHPLGGCAMGDSANSAVVDDLGQVFKRGGGIYEGLHVMDGSIIPMSLGVNPFLTIAALAWRACESLARPKQNIPAKTPQSVSVVPAAIPDDATQIVISEQMTGMLTGLSANNAATLRQTFPATADDPGAARWFEQDGLVLKLESDPADTSALLTGSGVVRLTATLHTNPLTGDQTQRWHTYGIPTEHLSNAVARGTGTVSIMVADYPDSIQELRERRRRAVKAYLERRKTKGIEDGLMLMDQIIGPILDDPPVGGGLGDIQGMLSIAEMQSTYRKFRYNLTLHSIVPGGHAISIVGEKTIAWSTEYPQLWQAMMELNSKVEFQPLNISANCKWLVDMQHLLGEGLFRIHSPAAVPNALFNCAAFVLRLARSIIQSAFWEFGAPDYPSHKMDTHPSLPKQIGRFKRQTQSFPVQRFKATTAGKKLPLNLHRYGPGNKTPVLLLHGLAQGSLIFAHEKLNKSMATYFLEQGYDVWLLDYRLSNAFDETQIPYDGWTMDELGAFDIPDAVALVHAHYNKQKKIHVFAHCVGAVAIEMAILSGTVTRDQIASVALNAIHPWVLASPYNRVRAKLGVVLRDVIRNDYLDPIIQDENKLSQIQSLLDRVGFSLARLDERAADRHARNHDQLANSICDRMTFLYGRMWRHENVSGVHPYWQDLVGRAPGTVYRHLYSMLARQRLLDHEGQNVYLTEDYLEKWMGIRTLFMHGENSEVFNPQSATRSAIRLRRVLSSLFEKKQHRGENPLSTVVKLKRIDGYGHMDVVLAHSAETESFPYLHHFFNGDFDNVDHFSSGGLPALTLNPIDESDDPHALAKNQPTAGLVLRAARITDEDRLRIRFWVELPTINTSPVDGIVYTGPSSPTQIRPIQTPPTIEPCYHWVDADFDPVTFKYFGVQAIIGGSDTELFGADFFDKTLTTLAADFIKISTQNPKNKNAIPIWASRLLARQQKKIDDFHFIVASCCYPGALFDRELADMAFAGIIKTLDSNQSCDLLFLIGDQIYADASAGLFDPIFWRDRYVERYRTLFQSPNAGTALRSIPTHFAIDDHEIANDYAGTIDDAGALIDESRGSTAIASGNIDVEQLDHARKAANSYMNSGRGYEPFGSSPIAAGEFWYALDHEQESGCPVFVMDTRSERKRATTGSAASLIDTNDPKQLDALKAWLRSVQTDPRPKFIFSGSAIVPLRRDHEHPGMWLREDGFAGYPQQLDEIIHYIVSNDIARVVFVGGDLHLSCAAILTLTVGGTKSVHALQIVSSGLYAPLPFANLSPDDVRRASEGGGPSTITLPRCAISYEPTLLASGPPHFVKVGAQPENNSGQWKITAIAYDSTAREIGRKDHTF